MSWYIFFPCSETSLETLNEPYQLLGDSFELTFAADYESWQYGFGDVTDITDTSSTQYDYFGICGSIVASSAWTLDGEEVAQPDWITFDDVSITVVGMASDFGDWVLTTTYSLELFP